MPSGPIGRPLVSVPNPPGPDPGMAVPLPGVAVPDPGVEVPLPGVKVPVPVPGDASCACLKPASPGTIVPLLSNSPDLFKSGVGFGELFKMLGSTVPPTPVSAGLAVLKPGFEGVLKPWLEKP